MAGALPILSGKKVRKAFEKDGWEFVRQRGSPWILHLVGILRCSGDQS